MKNNKVKENSIKNGDIKYIYIYKVPVKGIGSKSIIMSVTKVRFIDSDRFYEIDNKNERILVDQDRGMDIRPKSKVLSMIEKLSWYPDCKIFDTYEEAQRSFISDKIKRNNKLIDQLKNDLIKAFKLSAELEISKKNIPCEYPELKDYEEDLGSRTIQASVKVSSVKDFIKKVLSIADKSAVLSYSMEAPLNQVFMEIDTEKINEELKSFLMKKFNFSEEDLNNSDFLIIWQE